jgi:hypothetical protein
MKKGDKVKIYSDPITRERLEGNATIVKVISKDRAIVRFDGEKEIYERMIAEAA